MGEIRSYSKRQRWKDEEIAVLKEKYATASRAELVEAFPSRDIRVVECKAIGKRIAS